MVTKACGQFGFSKPNRSQNFTSCTVKCTGLQDTPLELHISRRIVGRKTNAHGWLLQGLLSQIFLNSTPVRRYFWILLSLEPESPFIFCSIIKQHLPRGPTAGPDPAKEEHKADWKWSEKDSEFRVKLLAGNYSSPIGWFCWSQPCSWETEYLSLLLSQGIWKSGGWKLKRKTKLAKSLIFKKNADWGRIWIQTGILQKKPPNPTIPPKRGCLLSFWE